MWVAARQPFELLYTCYLLTYSSQWTRCTVNSSHASTQESQQPSCNDGRVRMMQWKVIKGRVSSLRHMDRPHDVVTSGRLPGRGKVGTPKVVKLPFFRSGMVNSSHSFRVQRLGRVTSWLARIHAVKPSSQIQSTVEYSTSWHLPATYWQFQEAC